MKKGDIVLIWFPFSNLSHGKSRPCLVMQTFEKDAILCPLTTQSHPKSITISNNDLSAGQIAKKSYLRYWKITTIEKQKIIKTIARLSNEKSKEIGKIFNNFLN